jgi:DNA-binding NarL/FixJ family response regulator
MGRGRSREPIEFRPAGLEVVDVNLGDENVVVLSYRLPEAASPRVLLSPAQRQVLRLLLDGRSNVEIARERKRSPGTVAKQINEIYRRLGVQSRAGLASLMPWGE